MKKIHFLLSSIVAGSLFLAACSQEKRLPFYGERHAETITDADGKQRIDTVYKTIPDWSFVNQDSLAISNKDFEGNIYVADFFFTSCTTICPTMHRNMKALYEAFKDEKDLKFLSYTIDFKYDKPSVLKKYAEKLDVDTKRWAFVYGSKEEVYRLAEQDYLVAVGEDDKAQDGYIHQGYLILIDKDRRIRGAYDGTKDEQVAQLKKDIPVLLKEYQK